MSAIFGIVASLGVAFIFGIIAYAIFTVIEELPAIRRELQDMNALTRSDWAADYKAGRIEKPVPIRRGQ